MKSLFLLTLTILSAAAYEVTVTWDPNLEPDIALYRVYTNGVRAAEVNGTICTLTNIFGQQPISVSAVNTVGMEGPQCTPIVWIAPDLPPMVMINPTTQAIKFNSPLILTASATNWTSLQWFKNTLPIMGATNLVYSIPQVRDSDAGSYFIRASNSYGSRASASMSIVVFHGVPGVVKGLREVQ